MGDGFYFCMSGIVCEGLGDGDGDEDGDVDAF